MASIILDPNTLQSATKREIVIQDPRIATWASSADLPFRQLELTVVCLHCGGTPQMSNHQTDELWKMECACCTRVLRNPRRQS